MLFGGRGDTSQHRVCAREGCGATQGAKKRWRGGWRRPHLPALARFLGNAATAQRGDTCHQAVVAAALLAARDVGGRGLLVLHRRLALRRVALVVARLGVALLVAALGGTIALQLRAGEASAMGCFLRRRRRTRKTTARGRSVWTVGRRGGMAYGLRSLGMAVALRRALVVILVAGHGGREPTCEAVMGEFWLAELRVWWNLERSGRMGVTARGERRERESEGAKERERVSWVFCCSRIRPRAKGRQRDGRRRMAVQERASASGVNGPWHAGHLSRPWAAGWDALRCGTALVSAAEMASAAVQGKGTTQPASQSERCQTEQGRGWAPRSSLYGTSRSPLIPVPICTKMPLSWRH